MTQSFFPNHDIDGNLNEISIDDRLSANDALPKTKPFLLSQKVVAFPDRSSDEKDVLNATVEEARKALECDRVLVYSLTQPSWGMAIAESVLPGWLRTIAEDIDDPCFEAEYLDLYRQGRVTVLNDIYKVEIDPCYLERLLTLQVKASIVVPILSEGKLLGLLIAHQCSRSRVWQQREVEILSEYARQAGSLLDKARLSVDSHRLSRLRSRSEMLLLQSLADISQHLFQSSNEEEIFKTAVREVRQTIDCDRVIVQRPNEAVIAESVVPGMTKALGKTIPDPYCELQSCDGSIRAIDNIYKAGFSFSCIQQLESLEIEAYLVVPIVSQGELVGLLVAHQCSDARLWTGIESAWLAQVAAQVGLAIERANLVAERDCLQKQSESFVQTDRQIRQLSEREDAHRVLVQPDAIANALDRIQSVTHCTKEIIVDIQQLRLQTRQTDLTVQVLQQTINCALDSIAAIEEAINDSNRKADRLSQICQNFEEIVYLIKDRAKQMFLTSLNMTIAVGQNENAEHTSIVERSQTMLSLMQQLVEAIARIEPLFETMQTETDRIAATLNSGRQKTATSMELVEADRQKLAEIVDVNRAIDSLADRIYQSAAEGMQTSLSASQSIREVTSFTSRR